MINSIIVGTIFLYILYRLLDRLIRMPCGSDYDRRYVFITGCDTGFGHATAKRLDRLGFNVFAGCLTEKGEDELTKACSDRLVPVSLDVTDHNSITQALAYVKQYLPPDTGLWALVNNAGIVGKVGPTDWLTKADYEQVFNVNLYGLIDMTTTFGSLLKLAQGRVVNCASIFGRISMGGSSPYTCSKYGVEAFSDSLRREMRVFGVSVHIVEPGFHATNLTSINSMRTALETAWAGISAEQQQEYGREFVDKSIDTILKAFISGVIAEDISPVVNAYTHAVCGMFPRGRYIVGTDARLLWLPLTWLPEWLSDFILDKMARDKPLPACLKKKTPH